MWSHKHTAILGLVSAASLAGGYALGSTLVRRKLEAQFNERLDRELAETKKFYENIFKSEDPDELARLLVPEEMQEAIEDMQQYDTQTTEIPQEVLDKLRAAEEELEEEAGPLLPDPDDNPEGVWDQQKEEDERRNGVPYVISHDEFFENQWEFEEGDLIWYDGDGVLADSRDEAIPNPELFVGDCLTKFGYGSNDPNIVYVCNEQMESVFEICRSNKSFAEDVLGLVPTDEKQIKHSARRNFRQGLDE